MMSPSSGEPRLGTAKPKSLGLDTGPVEPDGPLGRQMVKSQVAPFGPGSVGEVALKLALAGDLAAEFARFPLSAASRRGQGAAVPHGRPPASRSAIRVPAEVVGVFPAGRGVHGSELVERHGSWG